MPIHFLEQHPVLLVEFRLRLHSDAGLVHKSKNCIYKNHSMLPGCLWTGQTENFCICQGFLQNIFQDLIFVLCLAPWGCFENRQNELMIDEFDKAAIVRPWSVLYQVRTTTLPLFLWGGRLSLYYIMNLFKYIDIYIIKVYTNLYISVIKCWNKMHTVQIKPLFWPYFASLLLDDGMSLLS